MVKLKICGINSIQEAYKAITVGADLLGLVADMPSGEGMIEDLKIKVIAKEIHNYNNSVLLTSRTDASSIIEHHNITKTSHIQLVDHIHINEYSKLKEELSNIKLIQVIHIENDSSYNLAIERSQYVDYLLLDSGKPNAKYKTLGGTGDVHNWEISKKIVKDCMVPVYLAGGINYLNVVDAIRTVKPYGIDLFSGLRTNTLLDDSKLKLFMKAFKSA